MESGLSKGIKSSHFQAVIVGRQMTYPPFKTDFDFSSICPLPNTLIHTFIWKRSALHLLRGKPAQVRVSQ